MILQMQFLPISMERSLIKIAAERILKLKKRLNKILSENTGKSLRKVEKDTERDYFMESNEALKYGIIDKILKKR